MSVEKYVCVILCECVHLIPSKYTKLYLRINKYIGYMNSYSPFLL